MVTPAERVLPTVFVGVSEERHIECLRSFYTATNPDKVAQVRVALLLLLRTCFHSYPYQVEHSSLTGVSV